MGTLRLLLAMSVVAAHLAFYPGGLPHPLHPDVAVQAFYVVSGFLITLVLHEKYSNAIGAFYSNRALRIFPIYWIAALLYLGVGVFVTSGLEPSPPAGLALYKMPSVLSWVADNGGQLGPVQWILILLSNFFIFGQDVVSFVTKNNEVTSNVDLFYHQFMVIRVAWTLAIELMFYLLAPFVVRNIRLTACLMIGSVASQIIFYNVTGVSPDWYSRIFPFALADFMAGALGYHAFARMRDEAAEHIQRVELYSNISCLIVILATIFYPALPYGRATYLILVAVCLPGIVIVGRKNPFDKALGEFSYPIYLVHPLFIVVIVPFGQWFAIVGSLLLSALLVYGIEQPLDHYRHARLKKRQAE